MIALYFRQWIGTMLVLAGNCHMPGLVLLRLLSSISVFRMFLDISSHIIILHYTSTTWIKVLSAQPSAYASHSCHVMSVISVSPQPAQLLGNQHHIGTFGSCLSTQQSPSSRWIGWLGGFGGKIYGWNMLKPWYFIWFYVVFPKE